MNSYRRTTVCRWKIRRYLTIPIRSTTRKNRTTKIRWSYLRTIRSTTHCSMARTNSRASCRREDEGGVAELDGGGPLEDAPEDPDEPEPLEPEPEDDDPLDEPLLDGPDELPDELAPDDDDEASELEDDRPPLEDEPLPLDEEFAGTNWTARRNCLRHWMTTIRKIPMRTTRSSPGPG